jgi:6-phosphogluconolactonase
MPPSYGLSGSLTRKKREELLLALPAGLGFNGTMELISSATEAAWLDTLTTRWQEMGGEALTARGSFKAALSGGSTPGTFYRHLARLEWPWEATHLFVGDERLVPAEHKDSNYRMIYEAFYPRKITLERWKTESVRPEDAATDYEKRLRVELSDPPRFDLIMLGIGDDGHTASLFPATAALQEETKLCVLNRVPQLETFRLTFTYPLIRLAREVWFVTRGPKKLPWIEKMVAGTDASFPAARVTTENGPVKIFHCAE